MRLKFLLFFIFYSFSASFAALNVDSLKNVIKNDKLNFDAYKKIVDYYLKRNPDSAFYYADLAYKLAKNTNFKEKIALFQELKGDIFFYNNFDYEALEYFFNALSYEEAELFRARLLVKIADVYLNNNILLQNALSFYDEAIKIYKKNNLRYSELITLIKKTDWFINQKDYKKAQIILDSLKQITSDKYLIAKIYYQYFKIQQRKDETQKALNYLRKSLNELTQLDNKEYCLLLEKLADTYKDLYYYNSAFDIYKKVKQCLIKYEQFIDTNRINLKIAEIYLNLGKYKEGIKLVQKIIFNYNKFKLLHNSDIIANSYKILSKFYSELRMHELAIRAYDKYSELKSTQTQEKIKKEFNQLYASYETLLALKDQEKKLMQQEVYKLKNKQQRLLLIIVSLILVLFIILFVYTLRLNKMHRENEERLKQLAEASLEGLFIHDGKKILDVNQRFLSMLGYSKEELIGKNIYEIISARSTELVKKKLDLKKTIYYDSIFLIRKDGTEFEAEILSKPFSYEKLKKVKVVSIRDIETIKQATRELEIIKNRIKIILDTFPDGIVITDHQGNIQYVSSALVEMFKADNPDVFMNKKIQDFVLEQDRHKVSDAISSILLGKTTSIKEFNAKKFNDEPLIIEFIGNTFFGEKGKVLGMFFVLRDVTMIRMTENALLESEIRFRKLVENAKDAIIYCDKKQLIIRDFNNATLQLTGYQEVDLVDKPLQILFHKDENIWDFINNSEPTQVKLKTKDNKILYTQITVSIVHFQKQEYYSLIIRDITKLIEQQKKLEEYAKKLEESNLMKDKLFSVIAHDLKAPIGNVKNMLELINEENFSELEEIRDIIKQMAETSAYSFSLLENLLNWARSQIGAINFSPQIFDISQIVDDTIYLTEKLAKEKEIKILKKINLDNPKVFVDENMITTVLRNLVVNAIKFTKNKGQIIISAEKYSDNYIVVAVEDNGIGIPEDKLNTLFDKNKFFSTYGTNNEKGTGLGLKIVKEFVEKHKGKIWVKSAVNQGTTFYFTIPTSEKILQED